MPLISQKRVNNYLAKAIVCCFRLQTKYYKCIQLSTYVSVYHMKSIYRFELGDGEMDNPLKLISWKQSFWKRELIQGNIREQKYVRLASGIDISPKVQLFSILFD